jgi:general secretion pathway protein K
MKNDTWTHKDQGFALVVVLLVLLLVTGLAAELVFTVRTGVQEGVQAKQNTMSRSLAKAGINLALFHLVDIPLELTDDEPYIPGAINSVYLATGKVDFQLISESGKMDLNKINPDLLKAFLEQQGYDHDEQEVLIDSMQDWIDNEDLQRLNGAEREYYETLTVPYMPKNGPFTDSSELFLVRGAEKLVGKINPADFFTIYNPKGLINFNTLSTGMLHTLTSGDAARVQQYAELKSEGVVLEAVHAQLILDEDYAMWQPYLAYSTGRNKYYTAIATGFAGVSEVDENGDSGVNIKKQAGCRVQLLLGLTGKTFRYIRWSEESIVE